MIQVIWCMHIAFWITKPTHTLKTSINYCFCIATIVVRMCLNITLICTLSVLLKVKWNNYVITRSWSFKMRYCEVWQMFSSVTCIHTHTHTHTHIYIYIYTHTHIYINACAHAHTHTHTYIELHMYIYICIHTCIYIYTHTYIPTYIHTYIHTYINTYIHTHTHT